MKRKIVLLSFLSLVSVLLHAQELDISNTATNASAELTVVSPNNNTGVLIPCMTSAQRDAIASPTISLLIYDTDLNKFMYYSSSGWTFVGSIPKVSSTATVTSPIAGDMRFQTSDSHVYFYNGTTWVVISEAVGP